VQDALIAAIEERKQLGISRYGRPLETHNGRDALQDAWEEAVDLAVYLTQVRMERADARAAADEFTPWSVWESGGRWFVYHAPTDSFLPIVRDAAEAVRPGDPVLVGLRPLGKAGS
jgi:hypothetical protein